MDNMMIKCRIRRTADVRRIVHDTGVIRVGAVILLPQITYRNFLGLNIRSGNIPGRPGSPGKGGGKDIKTILILGKVSRAQPTISLILEGPILPDKPRISEYHNPRCCFIA
jgi:hypothetical protein